MDLLFGRYASPLDFMKLYIDQGRFGEFVEEIIRLENKRKKEEEKKENENKLWQAYIHSMSDKPFMDWKKEAVQENRKQSRSLAMTDKQVEAVKEQTRGILKKFSLK